MNRDLLTEYRRLIAEVYELAGRSRATSESFAQARGQTVARWHILSVVSEQPHTVPAIARRLGLTRQSVQRVTNDLAAEYLIEFQDNPQRRRSPHVAITAAGTEVAAHLFQDTDLVRQQVLELAGVTRAELLAAQQTLGAINAALNDSVD